MKKVTAVITARGGSKGLPGKNVSLLNGKPLIAYTIEAALRCPLVDACYVTTEDPVIKKVSLEFGAEVIGRPPELATDTSLSQDAVEHALNTLAEKAELPEFFVLLQPTSPLRTSHHLDECLNAWFATDCVCAVSVTEAEHHPWKMLIEKEGRLQPVIDAGTLESPRQVLPKAVRINGAIYAMRSSLFLKERNFFIEPAMVYMMDKESSLDIDTAMDLFICESILKKENQDNNSP